MIRQTRCATQLATYSIDFPAPNRPISPTGTGFFVSPDGWFITAAHVITQNTRSDGPLRKDIEQSQLAQVVPTKERRSGEAGTRICQSVKYEFHDPATDLAILKVDFSMNADKYHLQGESGFPFLEVSSRELEEGEPVYAFGYPLSATDLLVDIQVGIIQHVAHCPRLTSAIVASTLESSRFISTSEDAKVYVLDKALNYGNSGGPIIAADTGKVHAICSRFQPVQIQQRHLTDQNGNIPWIEIPSLYGIVSSLNNARIVQELRKRGIPISNL